MPEFVPMRSDSIDLSGEVEEKEDPQMIILNHHDGSVDGFKAGHPEVFDAVLADNDLFETYLEIERDKGATDLAHAIANSVLERSDEICNIEIVNVNVPRGILDTNRLIRRAIKDVYRPDVSAEIIGFLTELHARICSKIRRKIRKLFETGGFFIDLHTMAPYSPITPTDPGSRYWTETPETIGTYVDAFVNAKQHGGKRRNIDLITTLDDSILLADPAILESFRRELTNSGIPFDEDDPYTIVKYHTAIEYLTECSGITVDVPRDLLTVHSAEEPGFDLVYPNLDEDKIEDIGYVIASALIGVAKSPATSMVRNRSGCDSDEAHSWGVVV